MKTRLKSAVMDGYRVLWKDDGVDYPALWRDFKAGRLGSLTRLPTASPFRLVFRLETERGPLLLKKDWEDDSRLEKKIWRFLAGPWYFRLIRLTSGAMNRGCDVVQDVYLAAEKIKGRQGRESYLIAEFVEGVPLAPSSSLSGRQAAAISRLHDFGLASNDAHAGNFILTEEGAIKIIDLSLTSPLIICQANDILRLKDDFGAEAPARGFLRTALCAILGLRQKLRERKRGK